MTIKTSIAFLLVVLVLVGCFCVLPVSAEAPWLEGYSRRELFFWQSSAAGQDNFTVVNATNFNGAKTFYIYNETQSDFEDLNVTLSDGVTPLALWNQTTFSGVNCTVWCNFPEGNKSYYLYWGNPNASASWNQTAVFPNGVLGGVAGAWLMNEGSGSNAYDSSGNGHTGAITGATWVAGKYGGGLSFNATLGNFVNAGNMSVLNQRGNFSFCAWVKAATFPDYGRVVDYYHNSSNRVGFGTRSTAKEFFGVVVGGAVVSSVDGNTSLGSGVWAHLVVSVSGNSVLVYLNNSVVGSSTISGAWSGWSGLLSFGRYGAGSGFFDGLIDDVYVFDRGLSAVEVAGLYGGFGDSTLEAGKVLVRTYFAVSPSIASFGVVESAPAEPTPTVDPDAITSDDAFSIGVVALVFAVALPAAFLMVRKRGESD